MKNNSKVIKCSGYRWESVPQKQYKDSAGCYEKVRRFSLLGEGEHEHELNFHTRYFEVGSGGYTSFEHHRHPHSVIIIRGSGSVVLGNEVHDINLHDVVYVSPETLHQFHADKGEPLGFLCVVDRYRDRPVLPGDEEVKKALTSDKTRSKIRR